MIRILILALLCVVGFSQCANKKDASRGEETTVTPTPNDPTAPEGYVEPAPEVEAEVGKDCIDISKVKKTLCPDLFDPVCGCNNITYSNECDAGQKGVLKWTKGACK